LCPRPARWPAPRAGEILIKVAAAGVNRPTSRSDPAPIRAAPGASDLPGLKSRAKSSRSARRHQAQARRQGDVAGGRRAATRILHCPGYPGDGGAATLSMQEAGAIPETLMTVWHNVFERGALKSGETAAHPWRFIRHRHHGDTIGQAFGSKVIVTVGSKEKPTPASSSAPTAPSITRPKIRR